MLEIGCQRERRLELSNGRGRILSEGWRFGIEAGCT
jgi:hypothetical protein